MIKKIQDFFFTLGEPSYLHNVKRRFYQYMKENNIGGNHNCHWELAKLFYPSSLAIENLDDVISTVCRWNNISLFRKG